MNPKKVQGYLCNDSLSVEFNSPPENEDNKKFFSICIQSHRWELNTTHTVSQPKTLSTQLWCSFFPTDLVVRSSPKKRILAFQLFGTRRGWLFKNFSVRHTSIIWIWNYPIRCCWLFWSFSASSFEHVYVEHFEVSPQDTVDHFDEFFLRLGWISEIFSQDAVDLLGVSTKDTVEHCDKFIFRTCFSWNFFTIRSWTNRSFSTRRSWTNR